MARTIKKGLDYFPVDTNILSDLKVRRIKREYGAESFLLYMTLLCDIYANGYWLEANDDYLFDLSEQMQISESRILEMLQAMAKVGMFDADLFTEQQILTSEPIQKQYFCIKKKYIEYHGLTNLPYLVISELIGITAEKKPIFAEKSTQRKEKESKEKESKEKYPPPLSPAGGNGGCGNNLFSKDSNTDGIERNFEGLTNRLNRLFIPPDEFNIICQLSNNGEIGHPIWTIIQAAERGGARLHSPGKYIISELKKAIKK